MSNNKVIWKGTTLLAPVPPVLVGVGNEENGNLYNRRLPRQRKDNPSATYH